MLNTEVQCQDWPLWCHSAQKEAPWRGVHAKVDWNVAFWGVNCGWTWLRHSWGILPPRPTISSEIHPLGSPALWASISKTHRRRQSGRWSARVSTVRRSYVRGQVQPRQSLEVRRSYECGRVSTARFHCTSIHAKKKTMIAGLTSLTLTLDETQFGMWLSSPQQ